MKFSVSPKIFETFSSVTIGALVFRGLSNAESSQEINSLLTAEESRIRSSYQKETFTEHDSIQVWRRAYAAFGVKPKDAKSSIENLYRIVLSGRDVRRISALVDIYNYISLKHMLPLGGEDLDAVSGNIELRFAGTNEPPVKLLGDEDPSTPLSGEVIYADSISAICRRWNWREADRTKLTDATKNCVLVIEGIELISQDKVLKALEELRVLVQRFCGGEAKSFILSAKQPEVEMY